MTNEEEKVQAFLETVHPIIAKNCRVVSPSEHPGGRLLHISTSDRIKVFIPSLTQRLADNETRHVLRISTSPFLFGCIVGHQGIVRNYIRLKVGDNHFGNVIYRGGYYIYEFENEWSVRPGSRLVYDVNYSEERWLVNYDKEHVEYRAKIIGKFFIKYITIEPKIKGDQEYGKATLYLECTKPLQWSNKIRLEKGHHRIITPCMHDEFNPLGKNPFDVSSISPGEYQSAKTGPLALLSHKPTLTERWSEQ